MPSMISFLAQDAQSGNPLSFLIFLLPIGLLFFLMRSQKRRAQQQMQLQRSVEEGDEILTTSGMFGTVVEIDDEEDILTIEIAPGTRVRMVRGGVGRRITEDEPDEDGEAHGSAWDEGDGEEEAGARS
jgi:preprotein translocase subunit YajC